MWEDHFGFLPPAISIEFDGGLVAPVPQHSELLEQLGVETNQDGYLYPPAVLSFRDHMHLLRVDDPGQVAAEMPRRPAQVFQLPASHALRLHQPSAEDGRHGDASFIMQLLAALYGYRLQFHDWWLEGRIPISESTHNVYVHPADASKFLSGAYSCWLRQPAKQRKALTNIAYMHSRAGCYEWHWEAFTIEYMVLDAIYAFARDTGRVGNTNHRGRLNALCDAYGLRRDDSTAQRIVDLRNDLFHEALWDGSLPGQDASDIGPVCAHQLRCLNHRLIVASLGWTGEFVATDWTFWRAPFAFG